MNDAPRWDEDGRDWPNRDTSRFVAAAGLTWHVQQAGTGPILLLLHGTGAATHSWAALLPLLAARFQVVALDLPGHGFTSTPAPARMGLPGMAASVAAVLREMDVNPEIVVGHSAGAAIAARMCLDGLIAPRVLVGLNSALLPLQGLPMQLFSPLARLLSRSSLVPRLFAWQAADRQVVERLLHNTGSAVPSASATYYHRLARRPGHAAGALTMMAQWQLQALERDLPNLAPELLLITGGNDRTIAPVQSERIAALVPGSRLICLPGLGHLSHEEAPASVAALLLPLAESAR